MIDIPYLVFEPTVVETALTTECAATALPPSHHGWITIHFTHCLLQVFKTYLKLVLLFSFFHENYFSVRVSGKKV